MIGPAPPALRFTSAVAVPPLSKSFTTEDTEDTEQFFPELLGGEVSTSTVFIRRRTRCLEAGY